MRETERELIDAIRAAHPETPDSLTTIFCTTGFVLAQLAGSAWAVWSWLTR